MPFSLQILDCGNTISCMSDVILCVVDSSKELKAAIQYACLLAKRDKKDIGLLYCLDNAGFQQWKSVETLIKQEHRDAAEKELQKWALIIEGITGERPITYIREGRVREQLKTLLEEEQEDISLLVLAASDHPDNPGPLVSNFAGKWSGQLSIPIVVVPGHLNGEQISGFFK